MPAQLTPAEMRVLDSLIRSSFNATDARAHINKKRESKGIPCVSLSTISRFFNGHTHSRGKSEHRGRPLSLSKADVKALDKARKRLLKRARGTRPVTHQDIQEEAGLADKCSSRTAQTALRAIGVRFRAPRRKVHLTAADAKERLRVAKDWIKRPSSFWTKGVHAYVDNKAFPLPLKPAQKAKLLKTQVTGHLRKASEGLDPDCTKPREKHSFLGIPSVTITAAVADNKIIMWHVVKGGWNGAAAASMYAGPLASALKKKWGPKRKYVIVEDGDRKGNQSGKGVAAKEASKIRAMTLPPRTPSWMPLDYAIWHAIEQRMNESAPDHDETKDEYLARLETAALKLPKPYVRKVIGRMHDNIRAVIDAKGYHAKTD